MNKTITGGKGNAETRFTSYPERGSDRGTME